ncbi:MAG: hypothetical protein ACLUZZ_03200 [Alistipes inops]
MEETMKMSDGTEYTTHLVNGPLPGTARKVSPNGKWIASSYRTETPQRPASIVTTQTAAFYNTETRRRPSSATTANRSAYT